MTGRKYFTIFKLLINFSSSVFKIFPLGFRVFLWNCITNHNQLVFIGIRYCILKASLKKCGDNIRVGSNVRFIYWDRISIGNNVSIHDNCYLDGYGGIKIGSVVSIAHSSSILSSNHTWNDSTIPIKYNSVIKNEVIIKDDIWIGCGVRVLAGVTIPQRSVIAAGAIVNKTIYKNGVYGGIPAKLIKDL